MKKTVLLILAVLTAAILSSGCFAEELSSGDYLYSILADGTAEILSYRGTEADISVPEAFEEIKVTSIGKQAFAYNTALQTVSIPEGVTALGDHAFGECTALTAASLPEGLVWMGDGVFQGCVLLEKINLPGSLIRIGWNPFDRCDVLDGLELPEENPFYSVQDGVLFDTKANMLVSYPGGLKDTAYTVPEWVGSIGMAAFSENSFLQEITLPDGMTELSGNPFCGCVSLSRVNISGQNPVFEVSDGALFNKQTRELTAYLWGTEVTAYRVPAGTASIAQEAFYKHPELNFVSLPESVRSIGTAAFAESGLVSIRIPEGVAYLGDSTFSGCRNLMTVSLPKNLASIGNSVFYECVHLVRIDLPSSLRSIGSAAFYLCQSLTSVRIPEGVSSIGNYAFAGCLNLTAVSLPKSLVSIGNGVFYADDKIFLTVPEGSFAEEWAKENGINTEQEPLTPVQTEMI